MKNKLIISMLLIGNLLYSQSISKSSIDSGGAVAQAGDVEIMYTIGEVNVQEFNSIDLKISEGFISSELVAVVLNNENFPTLADIIVFPNPVTNIIIVKGLTEESDILIYDMNGSVVFEQNNYQTNQPIEIGFLANATYLLKMLNSKGSKTVKIIKR